MADAPAKLAAATGAVSQVGSLAVVVSAHPASWGAVLLGRELAELTGAPLSVLCFPRPQWAAAIGLAAGVPPTTFDDARVGDAQRAKRAVASLVELRGPLGFRFEVHLGPPALVLRDYLRSCTPLMVVVARGKRLGGDGLVRAVRTVIARQSSRPALVLA